MAAKSLARGSGIIWRSSRPPKHRCRKTSQLDTTLECSTNLGDDLDAFGKPRGAARPAFGERCSVSFSISEMIQGGSSTSTLALRGSLRGRGQAARSASGFRPPWSSQTAESSTSGSHPEFEQAENQAPGI